jgi:hypothetical protein
VFENSLKREISNETAAISRWNPVFKHVLRKRLYLHQKVIYSPLLRRGLGMKSPAGLGAEPQGFSVLTFPIP